jgi:leucyl aminopeptidase (aminopeptidase T)
MMERACVVDYKNLKERVDRLARVLSKTNNVRVVSGKGHELTFSIKGRKGYSDAGDLTKKGAFGNLPAGEACTGPLEGTAEGSLFVDGSFPLFGRLKTPLLMRFKKGNLISVKGDRKGVLWKTLASKGKKAFNLAEFGIGLNKKARITGRVLEDEKVRGTCHLALGNNKSFGGNVDVPIHLDAVVRSPKIFLDGKMLDIRKF